MQFEAPLDRHRETVRSEWIDYNGHMNVAYYVLVFDHAVDVMFDLLGLGVAYREETDQSTFALEGHVNYLREVAEGDPLRVTTQLLDFDEKRLHYIHQMYHETEGWLAATSEWMSLHVDMKAKRAAPFPDEIHARIASLMDAHRDLPPPDQVGRRIGIRRKTG